MQDKRLTIKISSEKVKQFASTFQNRNQAVNAICEKVLELTENVFKVMPMEWKKDLISATIGIDSNCPVKVLKLALAENLKIGKLKIYIFSVPDYELQLLFWGAKSAKLD